ncbi:MAG: NADH-quinone oxidoreductase subunit J [Gemmatimonadetes bacterium]|nr:NADH-quinone oxidoreductase subunit J [Gemmatimonadota bacterium]MBI2536720.1 NADH-quinone oxidoreductase subunit J [Gemmatimonadota bacterium]MBI2614403.1 NADH-quinone oxidoreductase subunit J [Gemmatimonadota bacterium]MBI3081996.1 NADH-quinone oxidoreductase subunit J [Gemmatimonadota bacterium]
MFWLFAALAVGGALMCITRRSPVASALWLVQTLFSLAAIFVLLDAQFIAALQVMVYAGAIMVLFLFVIMLLNLGRGSATDMRGWTGRLVALALGLLLVTELWVLVRSPLASPLQLPAGTLSRVAQEQGVVAVISDSLFRTYLVPFEVTSVLLLAAIVGAVVLAKRRL